MKIFQTKISNPIAYLLIIFTVASVSLTFYGQFSNLEFESTNNTIVNNTQASPIDSMPNTDSNIMSSDNSTEVAPMAQ